MTLPILSILEENRHPLRIHLLGVAGSGMSGLAWLLMQLGHRVSGSDRVETTETARLQQAGLEFACPHTAGAVEHADLVIHSSAIKPGHLAYDAAARLDIPLVRRAEALATIMRLKHGVIVAGTHGKTTTSALCAHLLRVSGRHPSHYVGAEIPVLGSNAGWDDRGQLFVAEGDESDGTLTLFQPRHTILLNIEREHLDHYGSLEEIVDVFGTLLDQTSDTFVYCGSDPVALQLCQHRPNGVAYGWEPRFAYSAEVLAMEAARSAFRVRHHGEPLGEFTLGIPGRHNVLNALACIALAHRLGVDTADMETALRSFRGARRRFELRYSSARFQLLDDYGHHPTEVRATLDTARALPCNQLHCVFQPHRYSRTQLLKKDFATAFDAADHVMITDVYAASEKPLPGVSGATLVEEVQQGGQVPRVESTPSLVAALHTLGASIRPRSVALTLGAGDVHLVATALARDLEVLDAVLDALGDDGGRASLYEPMARHTTIRIGGPAQYWIEPRRIDSFVRVVQRMRDLAVPVRVIGRGSNLLVRDGGIAGAVIHPAGGEFEAIHIDGDLITAGVGVRLKKLVAAARNAGLAGFEWMEGIPGNVGGCIRMNAGAMGIEAFDQIERVDFLDPAHSEIQSRTRAQIAYRYRSAPEFEDRYAVAAVFRGVPAPQEEIDARIAESKGKRKTSQPVAASAGCIFKNPDACAAGRLVDELGMKGARRGAAEVSAIHGNFIVNTGGATAADVLALIHDIRERALLQRGLELETEVQIIGQDQWVGMGGE